MAETHDMVVIGGVVPRVTFTDPQVCAVGHTAAVPSFPTVSEVWLHLLEAYGL